MTITYHLLPSGAVSDPSTYQGQLWQVLCQEECVGGIPEQTIYADSKGIPTIGVGFNLQAQLTPVMQAYFSQLNPSFNTQQSSTQTQDATLMTTLKSIMGDTWSGNVSAETGKVVAAINAYYASIGSSTTIDSFSLNTNQIQSAFLNIASTFEDTVTNYASVPNSQERIALMSLAWNNPSLLGPGLQAALNSGNRAKAWFEIRYDSNGGASSNGVAKRRYFESQIFGLYNEASGASIPADEALQTYEMMSERKGGSTYRNAIFTYENTYGDKYVGFANRDYGNAVGITVQTLTQALQPAEATLVQHYVLDSTANPYLVNNPFSASSFNSLDIQVGATAGGSDLVASPRSGYQLGTGSYLPSLLIGQGGFNTLDDSGSNQNDVLIGGTDPNGYTTFVVGSGNDYIVAGSGSAAIQGATTNGTTNPIGSGNDIIVLGDANDVWAGGGADEAWSGAGTDTYYTAASRSDTIFLNSSGQSIINIVPPAGGATGPSAGTLYFESSSATANAVVNGSNMGEVYVSDGTYAINGDGNAISIIGDSNETVLNISGSSNSVDGGFETINLLSGSDNTITAGSCAISIATAVNSATIAGGNNVVTTTAGNFTISDDYNTLTGTGASTLTISGNSNIVTESAGSNFAISGELNSINAGNGSTFNITGGYTTLNVSNAKITLADGLSLTVVGSNNQITGGSNDSINVTGTSDTVTATNSSVVFVGNNSGDTVTGPGDTGNNWSAPDPDLPPGQNGGYTPPQTASAMTLVSLLHSGASADGGASIPATHGLSAAPELQRLIHGMAIFGAGDAVAIDGGTVMHAPIEHLHLSVAV